MSSIETLLTKDELAEAASDAFLTVMLDNPAVGAEMVKGGVDEFVRVAKGPHGFQDRSFTDDQLRAMFLKIERFLRLRAAIDRPS